MEVGPITGGQPFLRTQKAQCFLTMTAFWKHKAQVNFNTAEWNKVTAITIVMFINCMRYTSQKFDL